jgi:hypothetical protein
MNQLVITLIFILVSSLLLAAEKPGHIKCEMIGTEHKVYVFDTKANKYNLSLVEKGRPKTSLSRQIQQIKPVQNYSQYREYQFEIDDNTKVIVKMDNDSIHGKGELVQTKFPARVKAFSKCEQL